MTDPIEGDVSGEDAGTSFEVLIVGAGPAGTAAAITLARAGVNVAVIDKAKFPRDKTCGDGLTADALRILERLGLEPRSVATWQDADTCWIRSPSGNTTPFRMPRGRGLFMATAQRIDLDSALVDLAREAGASILDGHGLSTVTQNRHGVVAEVEGLGTVKANYVIGADGMWSPLRKALSGSNDSSTDADTGDKYLGEWHAFRQYFSNVSDAAATDLWIYFEADLVPGYFWSFPLPDGRANVGFGIQRTSETRTKDMKVLWKDLLDRPHIRELLGPDAIPEDTHRAWPIPARVERMVPSDGRALFVGDALGACDVMSGEGIAQALATGIAAAQAILDHSTPTEVANAYDKAATHELLADHRMSSLLVSGLSSERGANMAIAIASYNDWTRRNFARWLFEDYPRALIATPRRWKRGAVSKPGAYRDR
ncbi:MAG: geranylgeranyl reductase family protein [Microthrixaceae bacterium]|nr:geranylgeranyl reductase family protein [Microthrixaceae bacterium]